MLKIINNQKEIEINFEGIKIFFTKNTTKLYKEILYNQKVFVDEKCFKEEDIIYINEITPFKSFIDLNKKSFLISKLVENLCDFSLLNYENINKLINKINNELNYNLLNVNDGDLIKLIQLVFCLNEFEFINQERLNLILKHCFTTKKLFIFDNISWLKINMLSPFLNEHSFIILTNDVREYIENKDMFELICIFNETSYSDILDSQILINYLEHKTNKPFNDKEFNLFIKEKNSIFSLQVLNLIQNI